MSMDLSPTGPAALACFDCQQVQDRLDYCTRCLCSFCDACWARQLTHRPNNPTSARHEKVDHELYQRLRQTFNPPSDVIAQARLHLNDEETTWFAVKRDGSGRPKILHDSGRYASLVAHGASGGGHRFPAMVSFVGQTGAGKSTLIKMLIERQMQSSSLALDVASSKDVFPTPVVGSTENSNVPTSGDVHLYADPLSYFEERPIFYVDSEGLEGGEAEPIAAKSTEPSLQHRSNRSRNRLTKKWRFSREVSRTISWADAPEKEKRQFAVTHFYPRILYTFSDVIVFVLREPRTFESAVVTRLIDWAAEVLNASTNQPRLPHAIIVVNASHARTKPEQWNVEYATESLLDSVSKAKPSEREAELVARLMKHWHLPEKPVRSVRDLLMCYYSSVRVVLVPDDEQLLKLEDQTERLHKEIQSACEASMMAKKKARMLMNADELDELFQAAFDHFSHSLESPFDLIQAARKDVPIPRDFAGNVTKVAVTVREVLGTKNTGTVRVEDIFESLSLLIASCVLLECTRSNWKGPALEFFDKSYREPCENALQDFCKQFWPCEFEMPGVRGKKPARCVNTLERHQKGHQLGGRQLPGDYVSDFSLDELMPAWMGWIRSWLSQSQAYVLQNPRTREDDVVAQIHRHNLHRFFEKVGGSLAYFSHSVCLSCLRELPEHPLQCGHVLCTPCFKTYAGLESRLQHGDGGAFVGGPGQLSLSRCPLHSSQRTGFEFVEQRQVAIKPDWAGVRLLCLDGGGIRGIVELEVLFHIEEYLGGELPIQSFFDLIVGTSTGGIIAIGLGVKNWRVSTCIDKFLTLADKAFTRRLFGFHDIPIVGRAGRKYQTKPFEEILQTVFEDESLFGGHYIDPGNYRTKVAVTSTSATGSTPVVLANYNRPDESPITEFLRPDRPLHELKVWEAIRATTAAPGYFKPFTKSETGQRFVDGAVYYNNPVSVAFEESKLLWPDVRDHLPDIILSIGTGHNRPKGSEVTRSDFPLDQSPRVSRVPRPSVDAAAPDNDIYRVFQNFKMMFTRMSNVLSSHVQWVSFERDLTLPLSSEQRKEARRRLQRIDPRLGYDPPSLDNKAKMVPLKKTVSQVLQQTPRYRRQIRHVARRLVASSFYFDKMRHDGIGSGHYQIDGRIQCKFPNNTLELSHLGDFLCSQRPQQGALSRRQRRYPFFRIEERGRPAVDHEITEQDLDRICKGMLSIFDLDRVIYRVSNKSAEVNLSLVFWDVEDSREDAISISGFPRRIVAETSQAMPASPNFGTPAVSTEDYWGKVDEVSGSHPKSQYHHRKPNVERNGPEATVLKHNPLGIWRDGGQSWELRRVLRRRPRVTDLHKTSSTAKRRTISPSASDSSLDDTAREERRREADIAILLPKLDIQTPSDSDQPMSPQGTFEIEEDEEELNKAIYAGLGGSNQFIAQGASLVERERALALSLLEGRNWPLDDEGFVSDDFDLEKETPR